MSEPICQKCQRPVTGDVDVEECLSCRYGPVLTQSTTTWPQTNVGAFACHPEQVDECNARAQRHNIAVHYKKNGDCVIADGNAHKQLAKLEGWDYRR